MTLKNCAIRDEGSKVNKRHSAAKKASLPKSSTSSNDSESVDSAEHQPEVGSRFYVFSIYQRPAEASKDEKEGAQSDKEEDIIPLLRFSTQSFAEKIQWIDLISQACAYCDSPEFASAQKQQQKESETSQKKARLKRGTLPALVFERPTIHRRTPSGYDLNKMYVQSTSACYVLWPVLLDKTYICLYPLNSFF